MPLTWIFAGLEAASELSSMTRVRRLKKFYRTVELLRLWIKTSPNEAEFHDSCYNSRRWLINNKMLQKERNLVLPSVKNFDGISKFISSPRDECQSYRQVNAIDRFQKNTGQEGISLFDFPTDFSLHQMQAYKPRIQFEVSSPRYKRTHSTKLSLSSEEDFI